MITAVIIDDEAHIRKTLRNIITIHNIDIDLIGEASNKEEGVKLLSNITPDIILLDVMLGDTTSFEMLSELPRIKSKIIFISGHDNFAVEAFKFSAINYLLKPVDAEELILAVNEAKQQLEKDDISVKLKILFDNYSSQKSEDKKIILKTADKIHVVRIKDIVRCESQNNYTFFFLNNNEKVLISKSMKEYDELLCSHNFFRIHKSHLINLNCIKGFVKKDGGFVELTNGDLIPVSSRKKESFLIALENI